MHRGHPHHVGHGDLLVSFPTGALVLLTSDNVDGSDNSTLAMAGDVTAWVNEGDAAVADFEVQSVRARPYMKKSRYEKAVAFDGQFSLLRSVGSKTPLGFIHSTGVFDVVLCFRRRNTPSVLERRIFGGAEGQKGLAVLHNDDGKLWVILGNGSTNIANLVCTDTVLPLGRPYKVLIRGTGTQLKVSHDFTTFETQAFGAALGSGDSHYDYCVGACNPSQAPPNLAEGDFQCVAVYDRNLTTDELDDVASELTSLVGSGV